MVPRPAHHAWLSGHATCRRRRTGSGFSLVELVLVLVLIGVVAALAIPRWQPGTLEDAYRREQVLVTLRHAQRQAVTTGCAVQIAFSANALTLDYLPKSAEEVGHDACTAAPLVLPGAPDRVSRVSGLVPPEPAVLRIHPDGQLYTATGDPLSAPVRFQVAGWAIQFEVSGHAHAP